MELIFIELRYEMDKRRVQQLGLGVVNNMLLVISLTRCFLPFTYNNKMNQH